MEARALSTKAGGLPGLHALVEKTAGGRIPVPEAAFELTPKGKDARPAASQNIPAWHRVRGLLLNQGRATLSERVESVSGHYLAAGVRKPGAECRLVKRHRLVALASWTSQVCMVGTIHDRHYPAVGG